jgi:hypothetical protein
MLEFFEKVIYKFCSVYSAVILTTVVTVVVIIIVINVNHIIIIALIIAVVINAVMLSLYTCPQNNTYKRTFLIFIHKCLKHTH